LVLPRQRRALELVVEVDLLGQDDVHPLREFLGPQRAGHFQGLLPFPALIPGPDLGAVLDRPDRGMAEGEFQVAGAIFVARAVPRPLGRVRGAGHQSAGGPEVLLGGEAADAVDFEVDGERSETPDPGDPQEALDVGAVEEGRADQPLELA
jgi:hypothetical protein